MATAGTDYTAQSLTELEFDLDAVPPELEKTVEVQTISDSVNDDAENFLISFSRDGTNPRVRDHNGNLVGADSVYNVRFIIRNDGVLPKAWIAEYGHASGTAVVDAIANRIESETTGGWLQIFSRNIRGSDIRGSLEGVIMGGDTQVGEGPLRAGFAVMNNEARGRLEDYKLTGELLGIYPYAEWQLNPQVGLWGTVGRAEGEIGVKRGELDAKTDMTSDLVAIGSHAWFNAGDKEQFIISNRNDATWIRSKSDESDELRATSARSHRYRGEVEGAYTWKLERVILTPRLHARLEHNGGDIEGGTDRVLGAGLGIQAFEHYRADVSTESTLKGRRTARGSLGFENERMRIELELGTNGEERLTAEYRVKQRENGRTLVPYFEATPFTNTIGTKWETAWGFLGLEITRQEYTGAVMLRMEARF